MVPLLGLLSGTVLNLRPPRFECRILYRYSSHHPRGGGGSCSIFVCGSGFRSTRAAFENSSGFEGISTKLLRLFKEEIIKPLTCVLITGIFPNNLKLAKVITLHKKDDKMIMTNYMHISLFPFISKIIEKVAHNQISH